MHTYLVYYAYYHNDVNGHQMNSSSYVENTDVKIAKVCAESHHDADETCHSDLNLDNSGYIIQTIQI